MTIVVLVTEGVNVSGECSPEFASAKFHTRSAETTQTLAAASKSLQRARCLDGSFYATIRELQEDKLPH